jgi:hypothetical protein
MRRLTLWIVSTLSGLAMLITYQISLASAPDTGHHVPDGCPAATPPAATAPAVPGT